MYFLCFFNNDKLVQCAIIFQTKSFLMRKKIHEKIESSLHWKYSSCSLCSKPYKIFLHANQSKITIQFGMHGYFFYEGDTFIHPIKKIPFETFFHQLYIKIKNLKFVYGKIKHCFLLITEDNSLNSTVSMLSNKVILPDKKCTR